MICELEERERAASIFAGWEETMIWSCLQGVMGHIYVNDKEAPTSAMAILGDFCFFGGVPDGELAAFKPKWCKQDFIIAVPGQAGWAEAIENHYRDKAKKVERYAMKKEPDIFDERKLRDIAGLLPPEYTIGLIDESDFTECKKEKWCSDFVSQFEGWASYQRLGLGVLVKKDGRPVAGASSYTTYRGGIEVEIDAKEEYRRKGLASVCGARLILECLARNIYPSWDAQNKWSVALAEKLGYHFSHTYDAYEIYGY
ncbi:GNAT family N-acetyltransferase [Lachnospiraceae bacterium]|nr:GNAT family N-acetyltransferase [Lachnospiraceae bacterium]